MGKSFLEKQSNRAKAEERQPTIANIKTRQHQKSLSIFACSKSKVKLMSVNVSLASVPSSSEMDGSLMS